ncbi:unnamed protein product [Gongylonema pulchrum]|uniref:Pecanex-like protein n=1 Tax=Gongylonema pulchrum TaxID=637853 RepID=A0A183CY36_9BILA|nr:unnamed protein product [Gongylonema pulchrum]
MELNCGDEDRVLGKWRNAAYPGATNEAIEIATYFFWMREKLFWKRCISLFIVRAASLDDDEDDDNVDIVLDMANIQYKNLLFTEEDKQKIKEGIFMK